MKWRYFSEEKSRVSSSRRFFMKSMTLGAAGLAAGTFTTVHETVSVAEESLPGTARVSFVKGKDRRGMIYEVLKPFEKQIREGIKGKQVIIKPNFVVNNVPLCATHVDAVRGVLDFLKPIYKQTVIIGEATITRTGTNEGYKNYGYLTLPEEYNVKLIDFCEQPSTRNWIMDQNRHPLAIDIFNPYLDQKNYIISLTRLKTHDTVVATLTLKNIVMGAPVVTYDKGGNQKSLMHSGQPLGLNYNIFLIAGKVRPQFAILDGVEGMEGNGPINGTPVDHGVALAGTDCIAVDRIGVELMGINYENIGYLQWCARAGMGQDDLSKIEIIGPDPFSSRITYKLHEKIDWQLEWKAS